MDMEDMLKPVLIGVTLLFWFTVLILFWKYDVGYDLKQKIILSIASLPVIYFTAYFMTHKD